MNVTIGSTTFDRVRYDADGDVLALHVGDPRTAVDFEESPEGHALRFNAAGELVGVTIINAKWLLDHDGEIKITLPEQVHISPDAIQAALQLA